MDAGQSSNGVNSRFEKGSSSNSIVAGSVHHPDDVESWRSLVFADENDAYEFYARYGRMRGFAVRFAGCVKRTNKGSGACYVHYVYLECYKQGVKTESKHCDGVVSHKRADVRTNCLANMRLKIDVKVGGYVIYEWTDVHNHDFIDSDKVHLLPMFRRIQPSQKAFIDLHISSGISERSTYDTMLRTYGGHSNIGFTRKDLTNYVNVVKRREMAPGDATLMQKWFRDEARGKPGFFYDIQVDESNEITSNFWADSVMIVDYACFGDFVSFDTTYRTNKQYRPLGIFVGFNHHKGTCVFGGALLYEETTTSFKWLFETFIRCMNDKRPQTIMTDQAPAIAAAVREVLPGVYHALCSWHIDQNARKKLGARATSRFFEEFNHLIRHVDTEEEFEYGWQRMLISCFDSKPCSEFKWLEFIYGFRTQWSSAWLKSHFTAGKSTTQLSEQFNAFARFYLKPEYSVSEMLRRFQSLVDDLRHNEKAKDFYMQNTSPDNRFKNSLLMRHAALVFTPSVFKIIHNEYEAGMGYTCKENSEKHVGTMKVIEVQRWIKKGTTDATLVEEEVVCIDYEQQGYVNCSCRFLENWGLVCRHVLRVLEVYGAFDHEFCHSIPASCIKERWTRSFRKSCPVIGELYGKGLEASNYGKRYQRMYDLMVGLGTKICYNDGVYKVFMGKFIEAAKEAEIDLAFVPIEVVPSRLECSSSVGDGEVFSPTKFKQRTSKSEGDLRLMSQVETRHLIWKQQRKKEMAMMKGEGSSSNAE